MATGGDRCREPGAAGSDLYAGLGPNKECSDADLTVAYWKLAMVSKNHGLLFSSSGVHGSAFFSALNLRLHPVAAAA